MSHFVALSINSKSRVGCAVDPYGGKLDLPAGVAGGWGLGYFRSGRVLQRIEPREQGEELDVVRILANLEADVLLLHTREATVGPVRRENTHPFRFQDWLFAHNGTLVGFDDYRDQILETMPPFIHRSIRGDTDSEHLFHLFLSFLYDSGQLSRSDPGTGAIHEALGQAVATIDAFAQQCGHRPSDQSIVVSDGYSLVVFTRGVPVCYTLIEGVRDCAVCRISRTAKSKPQEVDHEDLRAVLVISEATTEGRDGFQPLADGTFLSVTKNHRIEFAPLV